MIIVFGSINMDLVFTPDNAPEAGETVLLEGYLTLPGGKGANQAVAAARMGSDVKLAGCIGEDGFGRDLLDHISGESVDISLTTQSPSAKTGMAIITVDSSGENRIMVAAGSNSEAKATQISAPMLAKGTSLLMQMEVDIEQMAILAKEASGKVDRVILNLAPARAISRDVLNNIDILILNEIEILQLADQLAFPRDNLTQIAHEMARQFKLTCVVTLGGKGAVAFTENGASYKAEALPLAHVVDTTGAGDAFCGTFAASLDQGQPLQKALSMACAAGSLACLKMGAMSSYPTYEEIQKYMRTAPGAAPEFN